MSFDFHAIKRIEGISAAKIREELGFSHHLFDIERVAFCLRTEYKNSFDCESGILNRLEKCAVSSSNGKELFVLAATKKYTDARLRRAALFALTGITADDLCHLPLFTVLLAANAKGREILNSPRYIETVTKPADAESEQYADEAFSDRLYTLCVPTDGGADEFLKKAPYIC